MKGYMLDTNAVSVWFSQNANFLSHVNLHLSDLLFVSSITLGEVEFGHHLTTTTNQQKRDDFSRWLRTQFPEGLIKNVTRKTAVFYGEIKAELFRLYGPANPKENHPERCYCRVTGVELGIDENDLWIAALALEHNLVLVSKDRMKRIKTAAGQLLDVEEWEEPV